MSRPRSKSARSRFFVWTLASAIAILQFAACVPRSAQPTSLHSSDAVQGYSRLVPSIDRPTSGSVSAPQMLAASSAGATGTLPPIVPVAAVAVTGRSGAVASFKTGAPFTSLGSGRDSTAPPPVIGSGSISRAVPSSPLPALPPNFNINAAPASQTVVAGNSTNYTISIQSVRGFADPVNLTVAALPDGASGSFSPNPVSSLATLTLATTRGTPPGVYVLAVTGASGQLAHTAYVTLSATPPPDFSLSGSPSSQSVSAGNGTGYTLTIQPSNGFSDAVSLSIAGLPSGGQGVFGTNPTATTSGLTVTTSRTTPQGSYTLTITGTSGPLTHSTSVVLVVGAPDLCGAPPNPWDYNFCAGNVIYFPPSNFCSYFNCIPSFWRYTNGYVVECNDGMYSHSGGVSGACSSHGGVWRALLGP